MNTSPNSIWFYANGQERKGPITFAELQTVFAEGHPASSLVWTEGMEQWLPASDVPELSGQYQASPDLQLPGEVTPSLKADTLDLGGPPASPIPLNLGFCFSQAWAYTKANLGSLVLVALIFIGISLVTSAIITGVATAIEGPPSRITFENGQLETIPGGGPITSLLNLVGNIVTIFLGLGATRYAHMLVKGESPEIGILFSQGSKLLRAIVASIIFGLATFLGFLCFIAPGIYIFLRFGLYQQAIVEKNLGVIDSLKYSYQLTSGNTLSMFGLYFLGFVITLAGVFALFIGLIWALPTVWLSSMIAFRYLHGGEKMIKVL
ncbi:DUF4339 domain-containing protein [Verrucomicrobiaceae bacterium 227]